MRLRNSCLGHIFMLFNMGGVWNIKKGEGLLGGSIPCAHSKAVISYAGTVARTRGPERSGNGNNAANWCKLCHWSGK